MYKVLLLISLLLFQVSAEAQVGSYFWSLLPTCKKYYKKVNGQCQPISVTINCQFSASNIPIQDIGVSGGSRTISASATCGNSRIELDGIVVTPVYTSLGGGLCSVSSLSMSFSTSTSYPLVNFIQNYGQSASSFCSSNRPPNKLYYYYRTNTGQGYDSSSSSTSTVSTGQWSVFSANYN